VSLLIFLLDTIGVVDDIYFYIFNVPIFEPKIIVLLWIFAILNSATGIFVWIKSVKSSASSKFEAHMLYLNIATLLLSAFAAIKELLSA
jgi:hypothetical protein